MGAKQTTRKRVVVFGMFDGVHEGHRSLFRQTKKYGDELIVIVGRDSVYKKLKGKPPRYGEILRLALVLNEKPVDVAVLGDSKLSSYTTLRKLHPDVICFGYDQEALFADLSQWLQRKKFSIPLIRLNPYKPHIHHNSLI